MIQGYGYTDSRRYWSDRDRSIVNWLRRSRYFSDRRNYRGLPLKWDILLLLLCDNAHNFNRMKTSEHEWWYDAAEW